MDKYNLQQPPNNITFFDTFNGYQREVLRITKDGITANPDVPVDEAAAAVIRALDGYIKNLTQRTWVGLTDEEVEALASWWPSYDQMPALKVLIKDVTNSLKEKNS